MAVDKSYGSGKSRTAANSSARRRVAAGKLTKGKKGAAAKIKAGRAKMAASPLGQLADTVLGFALPMGKVEAAARGLRAAGKIGKAAALEARVAAKNAGQVNAEFGNATMGVVQGRPRRAASESLYPKLPSMGGVPGAKRTFDIYADPYLMGNERVMGAAVSRAGGSIGEAAMPRIASRLPKPKLPKSNVSDATVNIVDTRRMNSAQAKSALEGGVNQTAKIKRRVPSAPKKVNKVTKRLLGGR